MTTPVAPARPSLYPILAVTFVGTLGFSIVLPFLVFLVTRLGGNAVIYGVVGATYSVFQLVGAPILGRWSDRVGRKKVLLLSQLGTLAAWGIFLFALTLPVRPLFAVDSSVLGAFTLTVPLAVLFVARALDGLTGGNVSVANAYLADITSDADRSVNFGRMAVASNLGFILGPAIAGVLGTTAAGERLPVLAALVISVIATLIILLSLRESTPCVLTASPERPSVRDLLGGDQKDCYPLASRRLATREILGLPSVGLLLALQFLVFLAFNFYYVAFPVHAAIGLGWPLSAVGIYFTMMAVMMATVQGPILSRLSRRWGDKPLVVGGSAVLAAGFCLFTSEQTPVIYAGTALLAIGNGVMWPSLLSRLSKASDRETQGAVQGLSGSVTAVASIVGLVAGGLLYDRLGGQVFLLSGAIVALVVIAAFWISRSDLRES
ncbi:MAG: MFS transporter [Vicinamibacterales bacterium]